MVVLECCLHSSSTATAEELRPLLDALHVGNHTAEGGLLEESSLSPALAQHVRAVRVSGLQDAGREVRRRHRLRRFKPAAAAAQPAHPPPPRAETQVYVHALYDEEPEEEVTDSGDGDTVAFQMWALPSADLEGVWESLLFDEDEARTATTHAPLGCSTLAH